MKQNLITATFVAWLLLSPRFPFIANSGTQSRSVGLQQDEQQIREIERQWTEEVVSGDTSVLERILADDFLGTAPDGKLYTKADAIKDAKSFSSAFESNHLNEARVRFFGDIAVIQGNESWKRKDGGTGRFVWTDVMVKRNGAWQIVAAEDLIAPEHPTP
jgi:ketosteroid isomerase-like protein